MQRHLLLIIGLIFVITIFALATHSSKKVPQLTVATPSVTSSPKNSSTEIKGGEMPFSLTTASEYTVRLFANNITNARDLFFTSEGTLLVSSPSTGNVYALPDRDKNGIADEVIAVASGLNNPHGLAMYKGKLFIAETRRVSRFSFDTNSFKAVFEKQLFRLPANINHNKRTIEFDKNGNLYTSVGSTCNVCEETDGQSGTVLVSDSEGDNLKVFSKGLRNAPFLVFHPTTGVLWSTGMGRDYLGDDLPPDEINILRESKDYGWPYCYGKGIFDTSFKKKSASYCISTVFPAFEIPAHSAPLGLAFIPSNFSNEWSNDLLVAYHGSWNRSVPDGYKVVRLDIQGETITSSEDFLTGFIQNGSVMGRPVDVAFDEEGYAYISDDKAGNIYIISKE